MQFFLFKIRLKLISLWMSFWLCFHENQIKYQHDQKVQIFKKLFDCAIRTNLKHFWNQNDKKCPHSTHLESNKPFRENKNVFRAANLSKLMDYKETFLLFFQAIYHLFSHYFESKRSIITVLNDFNSHFLSTWSPKL